MNDQVIHSVPDLGGLKSKTGRYEWNKQAFPFRYDMPVSFDVHLGDRVNVTIAVTQITGIPLINKSRTVLHR